MEKFCTANSFPLIIKRNAVLGTKGGQDQLSCCCQFNPTDVIGLLIIKKSFDNSLEFLHNSEAAAYYSYRVRGICTYVAQNVLQQHKPSTICWNTDKI